LISCRDVHLHTILRLHVVSLREALGHGSSRERGLDVLLQWGLLLEGWTGLVSCAQGSFCRRINELVI
jgi:hypothetical protein